MILVVLTGVLTLSPAISSLMNNVVINSFGQISTTAVWAKSGYWRDIQDAVNQAATYGIANVYLPEGTYNFVNEGESWTGARVTIPAGISIFGAPTQRTSDLPYDSIGQNPNDQVIEWKTVLVLPWGMPNNGAEFFKFTGTQDPNEFTRVSDIKFVGYREFDENATLRYEAIRFEDVVNFRVDHCYFRNIAGKAVIATVGSYGSWGRTAGRRKIWGIVDHCYMVNTKGIPAPYESCTVGYGVYFNRGSYNPTTDPEWEEDISKILGSFTEYTVFVENCYFSKWRHCIVGNWGIHYVFRHNTVEDDCGYGSIDAHGDPGTSPDNLQTRAVEIYNNLITGISEYPWTEIAVLIRSGGGVIFNNTIQGTAWDACIHLRHDSTNPTSYVHDIWIWNNTVASGVKYIETYSYADRGAPQENVDYFLRASNQQEDGFTYTPYSYPHPSTLG